MPVSDIIKQNYFHDVGNIRIFAFIYIKSNNYTEDFFSNLTADV